MQQNEILSRILATIPNARDRAKFMQSERRYIYHHWPMDRDEIVGHMDRQEQHVEIIPFEI